MLPISLQKSSKPPPPLSRIFVRLLLPVGMLEVDPNNLSSLLLFAGQNLFKHLHCSETTQSVLLSISLDGRALTRREDQQLSEKKGGAGSPRDSSHLGGAVARIEPPGSSPSTSDTPDTQPASQTSPPPPPPPLQLFVLLPVLLPVHKHVSCLCRLPANQFEAFI